MLAQGFWLTSSQISHGDNAPGQPGQPLSIRAKHLSPTPGQAFSAPDLLGVGKGLLTVAPFLGEPGEPA